MNTKILTPDEVKQPGFYWHLFGRWVDNTGYVHYDDDWGIVRVDDWGNSSFTMHLFNDIDIDLKGYFIGPLEPPEV